MPPKQPKVPAVGERASTRVTAAPAKFIDESAAAAAAAVSKKRVVRTNKRTPSALI